ncbi:unnamed protein product [Miscanthus lutarioriparius]|uniref:Uncharacterized protein n=1 Tax=Miscanthus lutarioriparius TaxID=422564 RepID=A0A811QPL9_9POAL|nr:unnamed protein product [Miscanthus lutarioriparius]
MTTCKYKYHMTRKKSRAISKTATKKLMIESDEPLEDDNNIHGMGNQDEDNTISALCGNLCNDEVVAKCQPYLKNPTAINDPELGNEQNESVVGSRQSSGFVTTTMEHNGTESIYKEEGIVEKHIDDTTEPQGEKHIPCLWSPSDLSKT